ncbi:MerR family transcriptional regulator [Streptomyces sp. NPDC020719]|uniref:MerR family transcriptional regulator n=1 Tax=unclassified Streptomyces TaxID=2593676 RepID=UPI0033DB675A
MRLTIGRLAELTRVPASAIRFWERHGLLPAPERQGGQRRYPPEAAERIVLLRKCQQAGLTLAEIKEFQQDQPRRQALIRAKLAEIEQRMVDLDHAHQLLAHAIQCGKEDILVCPTFRKQMATWRQSPAAQPPAAQPLGAQPLSPGQPESTER